MLSPNKPSREGGGPLDASGPPSGGGSPSGKRPLRGGGNGILIGGTKVSFVIA